MAGSFRLRWLVLALLLSTALLSGCQAQAGTAAATIDDHAGEGEHALETGAAPGTEEHGDKEDHAAHEAEEAAAAAAAADGDTHDHAGEEGEHSDEEENGHAHGMSYESYCECRKGGRGGGAAAWSGVNHWYHSLAPAHLP
jgi:hypothetical protein